MSRSIRAALVAMLVLAAAGCTHPSKVDGTWFHMVGTSVFEVAFLPDNGFERKLRTTNNEWEYQLGSYSDEGSTLAISIPDYPGVYGGHWPATVPYSFGTDKLNLNPGEALDFQRSNSSDLTPLIQSLQGMWKRAGNVATDVMVGLIFTPLGDYPQCGNVFFVGDSGPWNSEVPVTDTKAIAFATLAPQKGSASLLSEAIIAGRYPSGAVCFGNRARDFQVIGDQLTVKQDGQPDLVYHRVHGRMPFGSSGFDASAWDALR